MAGYTRQSLAQILNGEIVSAPPLNAEFNQILAAFNNSTGHKHDGTVAEGPPIDRIADADQNNLVFVDTSANQINFYVESSAAQVGQISIQDGAIVPFTDNDIDLGSSSFEFKDLYIDGTANIDSLVADTADINGGNIDGTIIGASTPAAATFTNLTVSTGSTIDFSGATVSNGGTFTTVSITGGTISGVTITGGTISGISNISDPGTSLPYTFSTTTDDADPGSGVFRFNNATQNAATEIYIDDNDNDGSDVSGVIGLLSGGNNPSSVLGYVTVRKEFAPENFITFKVTTVTSASGYTKLVGTVEGSSGATPFADTDNVYFSIQVSGDKGDPGDVTGPASSTDNAIVRWDGTGGNTVQNSGWTLSDADALTAGGAFDMNGNALTVDGATFNQGGEVKYLSAGSITTDRSYDETTERDISLTAGADINIDFETPNSGMTYSHVLWITQDGAGGRTITIRDGSDVEATWLGDEPTWSGLAASALTIVSVFYGPNGTLYASEVPQ